MVLLIEGLRHEDTVLKDKDQEWIILKKVISERIKKFVKVTKRFVKVVEVCKRFKFVKKKTSVRLQNPFLHLISLWWHSWTLVGPGAVFNTVTPALYLGSYLPPAGFWPSRWVKAAPPRLFPAAWYLGLKPRLSLYPLIIHSPWSFHWESQEVSLLHI